MKIIFTALCVLTSFQAIAQTEKYKVGIINHEGNALRFEAEIIITDSTFTVAAPGKIDVKKVQNRAGDVLYITNGTSVDQITIMVFPVKLKGFSATHSIQVQQDKRFTGLRFLYHCTKIN